MRLHRPDTGVSQAARISWPVSDEPPETLGPSSDNRAAASRWSPVTAALVCLVLAAVGLLFLVGLLLLWVRGGWSWWNLVLTILLVPGAAMLLAAGLVGATSAARDAWRR